MAPRASKQADRNSAKKSSKVVDDEPAVSDNSVGSLVEKAKSLLMGSCLVQLAPQLQAIMKDESAAPVEKPAEVAENENPEDDSAETDGADGAQAVVASEPGSAKEMFDTLKVRLSWSNPLGLAAPATAEESKKGWIAMKGLELDFGPKAKKRGNPALDRIMANFNTFMPQYFHILLAVMILRAFLFRSFFACLPWLFGYQVLSLALPLENLSQLPQVPLDQIPVKFRVAGSVGIHALLWLFFLYEVTYCTYLLEKIPVFGLLAYHAYATKQAD